MPDCHLTELGRHARNETCLMPFNQVATFFQCLVEDRELAVLVVVQSLVPVELMVVPVELVAVLVYQQVLG